jgi:exopolyphosphatase/guanosine-5'-triphosphate,3'-diphosphate pyrophosphatase
VPQVRRACIDIGSNTTRLLVAESDGDVLLEVHQERAFTHIGRGLSDEGTIGAEKIAEVVEVVSGQYQLARALGSADVQGVATAAIRQASNGAQLVEAIDRACGLPVRILSEEDEARLAFVGAARTLGHVPSGALGVVDVGGRSSELVVGAVPDGIEWCRSIPIGSGELADRCLRSDPPTPEELLDARASVADALDGLEVPHPAEAVAVGGSATSLRRLVGPTLDREAFTQSLQLLCSERLVDVARRFALDLERVRLLPAGLLILEAAAERFGAPLQVGRGGLREGILLEAANG